MYAILIGMLWKRRKKKRKKDIYRSDIEGCLSLVVADGRIGSMCNEQTAELRSTFVCCLVQWSKSPAILCVHIRSELDQQCSDFQMLNFHESEWKEEN